MPPGFFLAALTGLCALAFGPLAAGPAEARSASGPIRIVAFGDSLTAGYGLRPGEAFPAKLQAALRARGFDVAVANSGVSGDTSAAGLARVRRAVPRGTDLAIVEFGANDMLRGVPAATTERNLGALLAEVETRARGIVLAGMIAPPGLRNEASSRFDPVFARLAKRHSATLYPFFLDGVAGRRDLNLPDGLHPNAPGVDQIVQGILPTVLGALERIGAQAAPAR